MGVRFDRFSDFGSTVNPRFGLVVSPSSDFTVKVLAASAFRAPSFSNANRSLIFALTPNPNLEAENLVSYESQVSYQPSSALEISVSGYYYRVRDLITLVSDASFLEPARVKYENSGTQLTYGYDVELLLKPTPQFLGRLSYSEVLYSKSKLDGSLFSEEGLPKKGLNWSLTWWATSEASLNLNGHVRTDFNNLAPFSLLGTEVYPERPVTGYSIVNAVVRFDTELYDVPLTLTAQVNNLLDERQIGSDARGFYPVGLHFSERQWLLGMEFSL